MNRKLLFSALLLGLLLTACGADPTITPEPAMSAPNAAVQLIEQDMKLRLTQQSIEAERAQTGARMTATQQVIDATATEQIRRENRQATQAAAAMTQQVWQVTADAGRARDEMTRQADIVQSTSTAQAQATATKMAVVGLTATVEFRATATADFKTQQAPILAAQQRAMEAQAQSMETKLAQEKSTAFFWAWALPVLLVVALIGAMYMLWNKSQVGTIQADSRGNYPLVMTVVNGQKRLTAPALLAGPVLEYGTYGTQMPMMTDKETQRQTTHDARIVEAVKALQPGYQRQALEFGQGLARPTAGININVVQPGNVKDWLEDVQGQLSERVEED